MECPKCGASVQGKYCPVCYTKVDDMPNIRARQVTEQRKTRTDRTILDKISEWNIVPIIACSIVVALVAGGIGFGAGFGAGRLAKVDDYAVDAAARQLNSLDEEYQKLQDQVSDKNQLLKDMKLYEGNKEKLNKELSEKESKIGSLNSDIAAKIAEVNSLTENIAVLTGKVTQIKTQPKRFSTGIYIVGKNLPAGMYDIKWASGSGNFYVDCDDYINEIFGTSKYSIKEYKNASLSDGDKIEVSGNLVVDFHPHQ